MREHDIEYFEGEGHEQESFEYSLRLRDGETARVDASSTIITDEGYLIGGRLCVEKVMENTIALSPIILEELSQIHH